MTSDFKVIDEQYEASKKAMGSYVMGFVLSLVFTLVPYFIVVNHMFENSTMMYAIVFFALLQLIAQVIFFLHLHKRSRPHWNMVVFTFTLVIVLILVVGSLWVMNNLDHNMNGMTPVNTNEGYIP